MQLESLAVSVGKGVCFLWTVAGDVADAPRHEPAGPAYMVVIG